jgi:oligogalacturonide lyase
MVCSRRWFLAALPSVCAAASGGKGGVSASAFFRFSDAATEVPVLRLTDPRHTSRLPAHYARAVSRKSSFLLLASDVSGRMEAYRLNLKSGETRQLTDAESLDPASLALLADDREFCCVDGDRLLLASLSSLRPRPVYAAGEGFEVSCGPAVTEDGLFALLAERKGPHYRLQLVRMSDGSAVTLAEADEEMRDPVPRPRRASVLYRRAGGLWLANFDAKQNYRLRAAAGTCLAANWSPDGRSVLYLNVPSDPHKLHNIREFTPDTNEDKAVADTSQYAGFERNADATMFVGASGSKASPYVLLLARAVQRELTLCEHRASDPAMVTPVFSPNSQQVFFTSDMHGKPAIYSMLVDKLVAETADATK